MDGQPGRPRSEEVEKLLEVLPLHWFRVPCVWRHTGGHAAHCAGAKNLARAARQHGMAVMVRCHQQENGEQYVYVFRMG